MSPRERVYQTEAIVLRRSDLGEADRLLTVLTPDRGKIKLVAKGARKPASRKSGHVELFSHSRYLVATGRELDIITQADTIEPFLPLREDLMRTSFAYYLAELVDSFTAEHDENRPLFDLLREALGWLCAVADPALAARYFEVHLLGLVGFQPQLYICAGCRNPLPEGACYLSNVEGSVYCEACGQGRPGTGKLSLNALKVLRFLQTRDWETCRLLRMSPAGHAEVEQALYHYITYHLERRLKSLDFLHRLRRMAGAAA